MEKKNFRCVMDIQTRVLTILSDIDRFFRDYEKITSEGDIQDENIRSAEQTEIEYLEYEKGEYTLERFVDLLPILWSPLF